MPTAPDDVALVDGDGVPIAKRRISVTSPIGRALIGKTVGDTVEVQTPSGARSYEVVGVQFK